MVFVLLGVSTHAVWLSLFFSYVFGYKFLQWGLPHTPITGYCDFFPPASECGGPVHALFACAGVADGTPGIEKINFIGHRHLVDRMLAAGTLAHGAAIGFISSAAGLGWEASLPVLKEFLDITDFDAASQWANDHGRAHYMFTKQAICAYVARQAMSFLKHGIRINAICPGPTDTPLARANEETWLGFGADYREEVGLQPSTPFEQAYPLVFLCSDEAGSFTGSILHPDGGINSSTGGG